MENTIVRNNLMERDGYAPYCGENYHKCRTMPRTKWDKDLNQFKCPNCGFVTEFPEDFIKRYKERWGK